MNIGKTFYPKSVKEWRDWLHNNYNKEKEIWVVMYTKGSKKPSLSYGEILDEALCFGWIDSTVKKVDEEGRAQRYTPRRQGSPISELNKERLRRLIKKDKVISEVLEKVREEVEKEFLLPEDILNELKKDEVVWKNFNNFPKSYQSVRIAFIDGARRVPEVYRKRLDYFIKKTKENKKFGMISFD